MSDLDRIYQGTPPAKPRLAPSDPESSVRDSATSQHWGLPPKEGYGGSVNDNNLIPAEKPEGWSPFGGGSSDPETAELLGEIVAEIRRYVVISAAQAETIALWIMHTWALDAAEVTPYLNISGPERRVGKSRLLEVLALYAKTPIKTADISEAALFRVVEASSPTLLFDEIDTVFGPKAREQESLRGLLNAGFQRGAMAWRCVGDGSKQTVEPFAVFCAKAFAGIGEILPDTLSDRSIPIRLQRKTRAERVERLRIREARERANPLREQIARWAEDHVDVLADARPSLPDELDDRAQDAWEPLLTIADAAGGEWSDRARSAALELSTGQTDDGPIGTRLLADVKRVFDESTAEKLHSKTITTALVELEESPWGDWRGQPFEPRALARILKRYDIKSEQVWMDAQNRHGYRREQFEEAWERYLPLETDFQTLGTLEPAGVKGLRAVSQTLDKTIPSVQKKGANPHEQSGLADLAFKSSLEGPGEEGGPLPGLGDDDYAMVLSDRLAYRHITRREWRERVYLHDFVRRAVT